MARIVILGTGTDVGKTYFTSCLAAALAAHPETKSVSAIKPIESGVAPGTAKRAARTIQQDWLLESELRAPHLPCDPRSDAAILALASHPPFPPPTHAYAFPDAVSPHLAARKCNVTIDIRRAAAWVTETEQSITTLHYDASHHIANDSHSPPRRRAWTLIETAGAALTPLARASTNIDLAQLLEPAIWILVAPDRLGVLHDLTATLSAMRHLGHHPDSIVLSQATDPDPSTGTNAHELRELGLAEVDVTLGRGAQIPDDYSRRLFRLVAARGL